MNKPFCYEVSWDWNESHKILPNEEKLLEFLKKSEFCPVDICMEYSIYAHFENGVKERLIFEDLKDLIEKVHVDEKEIEEWAANFYINQIGIRETEINGEKHISTECFPIKSNPTQPMIEQEIRRRSYKWI